MRRDPGPGRQSAVFTQYAEFGPLLQPHLASRLGWAVLFLHGAMSKKPRDALVLRFERRMARLFVLSLKAGGIGLNLTSANHVIHVDRWWNPAVEDQATDRAFRIGQRRNVQVRKLVCAGTLEERRPTRQHTRNSTSRRTETFPHTHTHTHTRIAINKLRTGIARHRSR